jgi:hypothetical protein
VNIGLVTGRTGIASKKTKQKKRTGIGCPRTGEKHGSLGHYH